MPQDPTEAIERVIEVTSKLFSVRAENLRRPGRGPNRVSNARQIAMTVCSKIEGVTLDMVGAAFGGRHHTTVMHARDSIEERASFDRRIRWDLEDVAKAAGLELSDL